MGRPRKSDAEKALAGTLQKCRSEAVVRKKIVKCPWELDPNHPPKGLLKEARAAWKMALTYAPKNLLTALDGVLLERWCRNYALYIRYSKQLEDSRTEPMMAKETPTGALVYYKNPLISAVKDIHSMMLQLEVQMGFSPASRARVSAAIPEEEETNEFDII